MRSPAPKRNNVQDTVYQVLRDAIMSLKLEPGTVMSTQEMATRLKVSRTPVREAFIRLHEEDLVEIIPQRETVVSRINMDRVRQERFIRLNLELAAIEPFMEKCAPKDLKEMRKILERQKRHMEEKNYADFITEDNLMHRQIFVVAGYELAWDAIQMVNGHDYRFRVLTAMADDITGGVIAQHESIIERMEAGDSAGALKELTSHLRKIRFEKDRMKALYPDFFRDEEAGGDLTSAVLAAAKMSL